MNTNESNHFNVDNTEPSTTSSSKSPRALVAGGAICASLALGGIFAATAASAMPTDQSAKDRPAAATAPAGFVPNSASYTNDHQGWVLGNTGGKMSTAALVHTSDGRHWSTVRTPAATTSTAAPNPVKLTDVYFADEDQGWLFGGDTLYGTTDGGHSWQPWSLDTGSNRKVVDVTSAGGYAWAATTRAGGLLSDVDGDVQLYRTPLGTNNWQPYGASVDDVPAKDNVLTARGSQVWLATSRSVHVTSGGTLHRVNTPCTDSGESAITGFNLGHGDMVLQCTGEAGTDIETSSNAGLTWTSGPQRAIDGRVSGGIAVNEKDVILTAKAPGASEILRTTDGGKTLLKVNTGADTTTRDLAFTRDDNHAVAVLDDSSLVQTNDGGSHWSPVSFRL